MISFEELPDALRPYASWSLSMWFYTVSHSELVLQLRHPDQYRIKYLVLSGCGDVCIPAISAVEHVQVEKLDEMTWRLTLSEYAAATAETWRLEDEYQMIT